MPDQEQPGTAEVTPASAPEATTTPVAESPTVQPGETAKVESEQSKPQATNWEDPQNPWKQRYDGFIGNFKQVKDRHDQLEAQLRQLAAEREQEYQQREWDRQQAIEAERERTLAAVVEQQDGDAALKEVAGALQQRQTAAQIQFAEQQTLQKYGGQVHQSFQQQYYNADMEVARESGVSEQEIQDILWGSPSYQQFHRAILQRGRDKMVGNVEQLVKQQVDAALKAIRESDRATSRAAEKSPDTGGGAPPRADDDAVFLEQYSSGKSTTRNSPADHKRAQAILSRL